MEKINLSEKFSQFSDYWNPRIIGELNGQLVKAAKLKGEFIWHHHEQEDELFLVTKGKLKMEFRDKTVELNPGEMIIVPRGIEHRPVAEEEVELLLFEPASTLNTGNVENDRTVKELRKI
jgi:mannose-6-phosphate isomerase-like protein (cupin superfamily)